MANDERLWLTDQELGSRIDHALTRKDAGQFRDALLEFESIERDYGERAGRTLLRVIGALHAELGEHAAAEAYFRRAIEAKATSTWASLGLFHALWDQKKCVEALREIERYLTAVGGGEYDEIVEELRMRHRLQGDALQVIRTAAERWECDGPGGKVTRGRRGRFSPGGMGWR